MSAFDPKRTSTPIAPDGHRAVVSVGGLLDELLSSADGSCHDVHAGCADFCEVRLQTSLYSAAARLHSSTHRSDVTAAFVRNGCRPD